jgi:uncharacterized protein YcnI
MHRIWGPIAVAIAVLVAGGSTAAAHVTIQPREANQGGFATLFVQVPNEKADATTVSVELTMPEDHPLAFVSVEPVPGWTITPERTKLATPITSDDGEVTEAVSKITFSGGEIEPGEFQRFPISVGPLPTDATELVFKAIQTYSDGDVVRWIDVATAGGEEPEHPAPTVTLTKATGDDHGTAATTEAASSDAHDDSSSSDTLAVVAIVVGGVAAVLALVALFRKGRTAT